MTDEEAEIRKALHFGILFQIAPALCVFPSAEPPLLGEDFALSTRKLFEALNEFRTDTVRYLSAIPLHELNDGFTERGKPKTPERREWCVERRAAFESRFRTMSSWQKALFAPDTTLAKYDYWAKAAFFSLDETLWLSVGLEPLPVFIDALNALSRNGTERDPVVRHLVAQHELLRRGLDPNGYERRLKAQTIVSWVNLVEHELHPGFRRALETILQREGRSESAASSSVVGSNIETIEVGQRQEAPTEVLPELKRADPRERLGMAKLLVAISIEQFGYDPDSKKSPIPTELADIAARLGLELTHDTILKYLRLGSQHLPKDWKPHQ